MLAVGWARANAHSFHDDRPQLPVAFAEQAALAMQVARAQADQALLAVFEDRDRIGRDLHDLVIQRLFAIGLSSRQHGPAGGTPEVADRLSTAVDDIDATIKDIRRSIFALSTPGDTSRPARAARRRGGEALRRVSASRRRSTIIGTGRLDRGRRSVRPASARRPGRRRSPMPPGTRTASSCTSRLSAGADVELVVKDDGRGFDPDAARASQRPAQHQGASGVAGRYLRRSSPAPVAGTIVRWRVPSNQS